MLNFQCFRLDTSFLQFCHRRGKRCKLFSFSSKWFGNLKKYIIYKRLVNSVKYHYLSLRLVCSLFTCKKFENKCKNKHKIQIKLSKVETCTTDLASYSLTQWQFWQLALKWLSGARAQDKNNHTIADFLYNSRKIHYLTCDFRVKLLLKTDIALIAMSVFACNLMRNSLAR